MSCTLCIELQQWVHWYSARVRLFLLQSSLQSGRHSRARTLLLSADHFLPISSIHLSNPLSACLSITLYRKEDLKSCDMLAMNQTSYSVYLFSTFFCLQFFIFHTILRIFHAVKLEMNVIVLASCDLVPQSLLSVHPFVIFNTTFSALLSRCCLPSRDSLGGFHWHLRNCIRVLHSNVPRFQYLFPLSFVDEMKV